VVCKPAFAVLHGNPHVWVDGVRFAGTREHVLKCVQAADASAEAVGATWKATPAPERHYEFIGVQFNHEAHTVVTAAKTLKKISVRPHMTALDIEQLVGRLIFASGVSRIPLADFYFALKWAKRLSNKLNRGLLKPSATINLPAGTASQLRRWSAAVRVPLTITTRRSLTSAFSLYTDASNFGWGAVLINDDTAEHFAIGESWAPADAQRDISEREMLAVTRAVSMLTEKLQEAKSLALRIDNTSVLSAVRRGVPRADRLASLTSDAAETLRILPGAVTVAFVKSADNFADGPSRGPPVSQTTHEAVQGAPVRYCVSSGQSFILRATKWRCMDGNLHE
jgi:hypothetical protein